MRIKPKLLGWLIIAYNGFLSAHFLDAALIYMSQDFAHSWLRLVDDAMWFALLVAGIGLVSGKLWSKWVVVTASAVQLILIIVATFILPTWRQEIVNGIWFLCSLIARLPNSGNSASNWSFIGSLPTIFFLIAAWRVRFPEVSLRDSSYSSVTVNIYRAKTASLLLLDLAYASFASLPCVACIFGLITLLGPTAAEGIGTIFGMFFGVIVFGMLGLGIVLSVILWREWPLPVMSGIVITISFLFIAIDLKGWQLVNGGLANALVVAGVVAYFYYCIRWFFFRRKQLLQAQPPT